MTEHPNITAAKAELDQASLKQYAFKNDTVRKVACAIGRSFLQAPGMEVWADEVELPELRLEDRNVIGLCFRNLAKWGMIQRLEGETDHRRSRAKSRKGGVSWRYRLVRRSLLETFLRRNGGTVPERELVQAELC